MPYKLLALDIDGTLVKEHTNTVSSAVIDSIKQAQEKVVVVLVSARARADQQIIIDALELNQQFHVIENGTKVINTSGELEYTKFIPTQEVQAIRELTQDICKSVGYCIDGAWLQELPCSTDDCVTTISLIAEKDLAETMPALLDQLPQTYCVTVGNHWSDFTLSVVLISHKDASKGGGLRYVQQKLGISPEETIAVGDGASDVPMMQYAGLKIAMGNAEDKLKKVADHVVAPVSEDGVVDVINRFIL